LSKKYFNNYFRIEKKAVGGKGSSVYIIAEAGSNHNNNIDQAKKLIDIAAESGADAVKFQLFKAKDLLKNKDTKIVKYLQKFEFNRGWLKELLRYSKKKKITFLASAFDKKAVDLLVDLGVSAIKIASSENLNKELIFYAAKTNLPLIISTGISNFSDIYETLEIVKESGNKNIALLQCTSIYPCKPEDLNLNVISTFCNLYKFPIGFSDHSLGITAPLIAFAKGARIIEKHFTSDKKLEGPDHFYSLDKIELTKMVLELRIAEKMFGSSTKDLLKEEYLKCRVEGIYASRDIKKNSRLSIKDIFISTPRIGVGKRYKDLVIKLKSLKNIKKGSAIKWEDLKN
jgi:N,N'-diacetyllegionaminate synthase